MIILKLSASQCDHISEIATKVVVSYVSMYNCRKRFCMNLEDWYGKKHGPTNSYINTNHW